MAALQIPTVTFEAAFRTVPLPSEDLVKKMRTEEYRLFLVTNKGKQKESIGSVAKHNKVYGNLALGIAGLGFLNLVAARAIEPFRYHLIMVDINPDVIQFWQKASGIFKKILDATSAKKELLELLNAEYSKFYNAKNYIAINTSFLEQEITSGISIFSSQQNYDKIAAIFRNNTVAIVNADLGSLQSFERIQKVCAEWKCTIDMLYLSNVSEYLSKFISLGFSEKSERVQNFLKGIQLLTRPNAGASLSEEEKDSDKSPLYLLIRSKPRKCLDCFLNQEVLLIDKPEIGFFSIPREHDHFILRT